ncbi:hypothetical protein INN71_13645 [Nocardioides sp. ChNu-153]|uniref:hypothetical protein n=1 Tax=unclassified Nocardioides TaxID=2615069 RepID=UPI002404EE24|nr:MULTISPECIES: hypothetical protein [unclassified Nocardioides]MDF9714973.1 hypothetical protein [Nocardioides sp. ChNu-99]MDN7122430.1 hypothetical protein [Nocardioides sp. ChNu-153]
MTHARARGRTAVLAALLVAAAGPVLAGCDGGRLLGGGSGLPGTTGPSAGEPGGPGEPGEGREGRVEGRVEARLVVDEPVDDVAPGHHPLELRAGEEPRPEVAEVDADLPDLAPGVRRFQFVDDACGRVGEPVLWERDGTVGVATPRGSEHQALDDPDGVHCAEPDWEVYVLDVAPEVARDELPDVVVERVESRQVPVDLARVEAATGLEVGTGREVEGAVEVPVTVESEWSPVTVAAPAPAYRRFAWLLAACETGGPLQPAPDVVAEFEADATHLRPEWPDVGATCDPDEPYLLVVDVRADDLPTTVELGPATARSG